MEVKNAASHSTEIRTCCGQQSLHLPEEIIGEIFSRSSVKSLLRLRCVSKSCYSLIGSKPFIKKHLQNSAKNTTSLSETPSTQYSLEQDVKTNAVLYDPVGCCNGLVCMMYIDKYTYCKKFILWNPSTRISNKLPDIDDKSLDIVKYGYGWDETSDDYKVVVIFTDQEKESIAKLYSLKSTSWKNLDALDFYIACLSYDHGVLVSGKLHWVIDSSLGRKICCFDLQREVFDMVEQPTCSSLEGRSWMSVGKLRECLSLHFDYDSREDIWVMKEYGVQESWEKLVILDVFDRPIWISPSVAPFCTGEQGEILIINRRRSVLTYVKSADYWSMFSIASLVSDVYVESLVSPLE